jgi:hypothetical protein
VCFLAFILFQVLAASNKISEETYTYASSFFVSLVIVATIAGFVYSMKGLEEPISVKNNWIIGKRYSNCIIYVVIVANVIALAELSKMH